jgi:AraC family transcriptional regulator
MIQPIITSIPAKKLIGLQKTMSLVNFNIGELWGAFGPRRVEIKNNVNSELVSLAVYPGDYFESFSPSRNFQRWALVEVTDFNCIPDQMESFDLPSGLYAVFHYQGLNSDSSIFQYIYNVWLPQSEYRLDDRPHFEILGEKYKNNDPLSEEDIWIPIRKK